MELDIFEWYDGIQEGSNASVLLVHSFVQLAEGEGTGSSDTAEDELQGKYRHGDPWEEVVLSHCVKGTGLHCSVKNTVSPCVKLAYSTKVSRIHLP